MFEYEVYIGERLLTAVIIILIILLCIRSKTATAHVMTGMVIAFVIGISVCFGVAAVRGFGTGKASLPLFEKSVGTLNVVISLGAADFDPQTDRTFRGVFERADERMYQRKTELKQKGAIVRD